MKAYTGVKASQDDDAMVTITIDIPSATKSEMDMQKDVPAALGFLRRHNQLDLAAMLGLSLEGTL